MNKVIANHMKYTLCKHNHLAPNQQVNFVIFKLHLAIGLELC
jgi:hypothetical protein